MVINFPGLEEVHVPPPRPGYLWTFDPAPLAGYYRVSFGVPLNAAGSGGRNPVLRGTEWQDLVSLHALVTVPYVITETEEPW